MENHQSYPRAIDLFCGAGGSSYGARKAGAHIVAGFDIWEPAIKVFRENFPESLVFQSDIRTIKIEEIKPQIGKIDLILASPECTNHSKAKGGGPISEESRNTAFEVVRFAKAILPTWIVIENVVEITQWSRFEELITQLKSLGYFIKKDLVLDSKNYGVPQSRKRLFIICSLLRQPEIAQSEINVATPVCSILEHFDKYKTSDLRKEGRAQSTINKANKAIATIGGDSSFILVYYGSAKNGSGGWQRLEEPLRTITTLDRFAYIVPQEGGHQMRMLQPEELKLAMGYNPDFKLATIENLSRRNQIKLMGNGVCPPVMEAIIKVLVQQRTSEPKLITNPDDFPQRE